MEFDEANLVIISTMNRTEAKAFVLFLSSEILRHKEDMTKAKLLIEAVCNKFKLSGGDFEDETNEVKEGEDAVHKERT